MLEKSQLRTVPESLDQKYGSEHATGHRLLCLKHDFAPSKESVAEFLDRKYDFQPASGHCFFCLKHGFAITMVSEVILNPQ
jgi:hypothetical protein